MAREEVGVAREAAVRAEAEAAGLRVRGDEAAALIEVKEMSEP